VHKDVRVIRDGYRAPVQTSASDRLLPSGLDGGLNSSISHPDSQCGLQHLRLRLEAYALQIDHDLQARVARKVRTDGLSMRAPRTLLRAAIRSLSSRQALCSAALRCESSGESWTSVPMGMGTSIEYFSASSWFSRAACGFAAYAYPYSVRALANGWPRAIKGASHLLDTAPAQTVEPIVRCEVLMH